MEQSKPNTPKSEQQNAPQIISNIAINLYTSGTWSHFETKLEKQVRNKFYIINILFLNNVWNFSISIIL